MEYANLLWRALAFLLDLVILGALTFVVGTAVLVPLGMVAGVILGTRWDWSGYTLGTVSVIFGGLILVSYIYFVWGFRKGATPGQRLFNLALVQPDGSAPNLKQATLRYLTGFLIPFSLPILVHAFVESSWTSRHAALEPKFDVPARRLIVPAEVSRARREWEAAGQRMRERLDVLLWLLYAGELGLMGLIMFLHPQRQGWHDRSAGTFVIPGRPPTKSTY